MDSKLIKSIRAATISNLSSAVLSDCPHHLIPGHNKQQSDEKKEQQNKTLESEMFQAYPYYCELPKPLLPPAKMKRDCYGPEDLSMQLIYTKAKIKDDINRYLEIYKKHPRMFERLYKKDIIWTKENEAKSTTIPRYLAETAEIIECDPDPDFFGTYNWYYTGGTLNGIFYDMKNILIFPFAGELITLPIELKDDLCFVPNTKDASKIAMSSDVFQIVCSVTNSSGRILTRHKNGCHLYSIFDLDKRKLKLMDLTSQVSEKPLVSADLDPFNINRYCTANVNRHIIIWDAVKSKRILQATIPTDKSLEDNWAFIKYDESDENIIKYIDRNCVQFYDTRQEITNSILTMNPKTNLDECENLSMYIASCKSDYYSYVTSNHSVCLLDSRFPARSVVKKWTHQFKSSPLFADVCFRENKEFLSFASQIAGEKAIILNNWITEEKPPETCSTPFTPPSCMDTLNASRAQGKCLSPYLNDRLTMCNTGCMSFVDKQSNDIFLMTQKTINDIFYQAIGHIEHLDNYSLENCKSIYKLKMWEREILKRDSHDIVAPLVVTKRASARDLFRCFTNTKLDANDAQSVEQPVEDGDIELPPKWKRTVSELREYCDILAPELLIPWDIAEDKPFVPIAAAPHEKVLSWLGYNEKSEAEEGESNEANEMQQTNVAETQETSIKQDPTLNDMHDSESIQHLFLPKVVSQATPKDKKVTKRMSFVPGF